MNVVLDGLANVFDSTDVGIVVRIILTELKTKMETVNQNFSHVLVPSPQFEIYLTFAKREGIRLPSFLPWGCCKV